MKGWMSLRRDTSLPCSSPQVFVIESNFKQVQNSFIIISFTFVLEALIYISQSSMQVYCFNVVNVCVFLFCTQDKTFQSDIDSMLKAMGTCCSVCINGKKLFLFCFVYSNFNIYHFWCSYQLLTWLMHSLSGGRSACVNIPASVRVIIYCTFTRFFKKVYFCGLLPCLQSIVLFDQVFTG